MATPSGAIGSSKYGGYIYNKNFIGPLGPNDIRAGQTSSPAGSVLGAGTSTYDAASPASAPVNNSMLDQLGQNTQNIYNDQLNSERSLYDQRAGELNNQLGGLEREQGSMLDRIGSTYRGLVDTANQTLSKNVGLLEGRKGEVEQQYDTGRTNAARLLGDEQRMNRQMARAQNLLSSGFYTNLQNQAGRSATERVSGLNTEEMSKLDAIGSSILNTQTDTNTKVQALREEQGMQENETRNKYITLANSIRNDLRFNEKDKLDALRAVNNRMASALDGIGLTFMQYQAAAGQLGTTAANQRQSIQSYDPFSAIQSTLGQDQAYGAAYQPASPGLGASDQPATTAPVGQYDFNNRPRSILDDLLVQQRYR